MSKVHFWRGVEGNDERFLPYSDVIERLLRGDWHGLHVEKLRGFKQILYSARLNKADRLIFTSYEGRLCLLDIVLDHKYEKSRFSKKGVLAEYIQELKKRHLVSNTAHKKWALTPIAREEFDKDFPNISQDVTTKTMVFHPVERYRSRLITLSLEQEEAIQAQLPAIVYGPAGSGKSCVALSMLSSYIRKHRDDPKAFPIIYLSQSEALVNTMRRLWQEMGAEPGLVEFKTYDSIVKKMLNGRELAGESVFTAWYNKYVKSPAVKQLKQQVIPADLMWQEFRICSGYEEANYCGLGRRQSSIDGEARAFVYAAYRQFVDYLKENNLVLPALFTWTDIQTHYAMVVVDEAQDFSYQQLQNLYLLAYQGNIAYFLGDHQILHDGKSRFPFLKALFHNVKQQPTEIALKVTYRCAQEIIDVAKNLIKLKYKVTGGAADKIENSELVVADEHHTAGEVRWVTLQELEQPDISEPWMEEAKSVNLAVVTWAEFRDEASHRFNTPLVFTPEEIKGLEYRTIIAYRLFDNKECINASGVLKLNSDKQEPSGLRAKAERDNDRYARIFNTLFTAITRAERRLVFVQDEWYEISPLLEPLKQASYVSSQCAAESVEPIADTSTEDWEQQAYELLINGQTNQAKDIFLNKLNGSLENFDQFKAALDEEEPSPRYVEEEKPKIEQTAKASVPEKPRRPKLAKQEVAGLLMDEVNIWLAQDKGITEEQLKTLLTSPNALSLLFNESVEPAPASVQLIDCLFQMPHFLIFLKVLQSDDALTLQFLNQTDSKLGLSGLSGLLSHEKGLNLFKNLLKRHPKLLTSINVNALCIGVIAGQYQATSALYWLARDIDDTKAHLEIMLQSKKLLNDKIFIEALCRTLPEHSNIQANTSPLYWLLTQEWIMSMFRQFERKNLKLFANKLEAILLLPFPESSASNASSLLLNHFSISMFGMNLLQELLFIKPSLAMSISAKALCLAPPQAAEHFVKGSPLHFFSMDSRGCKLLLGIFKQNKLLAKEVTGDALCRRVDDTFAGGASPLYWLSSDEIGLSVLSLLFKKRPELVYEISAEALYMPLFESAKKFQGYFAFYWLVINYKHKDLNFLDDLLKKNPELNNDQLVNLLYSPLPEPIKFSGIPLLYFLIGSKKGTLLFNWLLDNNPKLVAIPAETLNLKLPESAEPFKGFPLLFLFCTALKLQQLLQIFLEKNPTLVKEISSDALCYKTNDLTSPNHGMSCLYQLAQTPSGCATFRYFLENHPDLRQKISQQDLYFPVKGSAKNSFSSLFKQLSASQEGRDILQDFFFELIRPEPNDSAARPSHGFFADSGQSGLSLAMNQAESDQTQTKNPQTKNP